MERERPRRRRQRNRQQQQQQQQNENNNAQSIPGLGSTNQAGELVHNTAGNTVHGATNAAGKAVGGVLSKNNNSNNKDSDDSVDKKEEKNEQLRLRLDLNLDIEVQLKAKIHGDLTLGLLSVFPFPFLFDWWCGCWLVVGIDNYAIFLISTCLIVLYLTTFTISIEILRYASYVERNEIGFNYYAMAKYSGYIPATLNVQPKTKKKWPMLSSLLSSICPLP